MLIFVLRKAASVTVLLLGVTAVVTLLIGIPLGIVAALRRDTWIDRVAIGVSVAGLSLPNFVVGVLLILLFGVGPMILPTTGSETVWHLVLPVMTMATGDAAVFARFIRSAMLGVLSQPYMRTASAKGRVWRDTAIWHALPNAAIPLVTVIGLYVGRIIASAIIVNMTLNFPETVLLETSLSFLGLGIQPALTSLGNMVGFGRDYLLSAWWITASPAVAIFLTTLAFSLLGDWPRDRLDPTLRGR